MLLQVMLFTGPIAQIVAHRMAIGNPVVERATLSIPDTMFLFVVALVVFGPKRLPEIGKQIGKLVFEFRRASNDFKLQIEEELRVAEQQDRQKQIEQVAVSKPSTPAVAAAQLASSAGEDSLERQPPDRSNALSVQPPSSGTPVSALPPNHAAINVEVTGPDIPPASAPPDADPASDAVTTEPGTQHG
jgi:sec-independent protein translocase protein TatB